jgi:hypothetical protein
MNKKAAELHRRSVVVDGHNNIMHELPKRRLRGDRSVFSSYYAPLIRAGGVNALKGRLIPLRRPDIMVLLRQ